MINGALVMLTRCGLGELESGPYRRTVRIRLNDASRKFSGRSTHRHDRNPSEDCGCACALRRGSTPLVSLHLSPSLFVPRCPSSSLLVYPRRSSFPRAIRTCPISARVALRALIMGPHCNVK